LEDEYVYRHRQSTDVAKNSGRIMTNFLTAAEVFAEIDGWHDISERRQRDFKSVINSLKRAYGRPLEAIRMDPDDLAKVYLNTSPAVLGIKETSLRGYQSSMRAILRHLGLVAKRRRLATPLAGEWQALRDALPDQFISIRLQAFMAFCSDCNVMPSDVTEQTVMHYLEHLRSLKTGAQPSLQIRRVVTAWNRAQSLIPAWPRTLLVGPDLSKRYAPALSEYPQSLQIEVSDLMARLQFRSDDSLFVEGVPPKPLKDASIRLRLSGIKYAAAALVKSGMAPAEINSLAVLVAPPNVQTILDWHWRRAGKAKTDHLATIAAALRLIATTGVSMSDKERERVLEMTRRAKPKKRTRMEPKRERRLLQLEDPDIEAALLHLPRRIMMDAVALKNSGQLQESAWLAGVAVAIAIELRCPMRAKNLAALELGRHLVKLDSRSAVWTHIVIEDDEVKNEEPLRWPLSRSVADLIEGYVAEFRVHLTHHDSPFLFPNRDHTDQPRVAATLSRAVIEAISWLVGIKLTLHDFRAFAGWQILKENLASEDELRQVLGHKTLATTRAYYMSFQPARAAERYNSLIDQKLTQTASRADVVFRRSGPKSLTRQQKPMAPR
jgi:integrase